MKPNLPRAARNYMEQLRRELDFLSVTERAEVLRSTREQITALPGRGRRRDDLIAHVGEPAMVALRFQRAQPQELKVSSGKQFLTRILAWPIFALAVLTAALVVLAPEQLNLASAHTTQVVSQSFLGDLVEVERFLGPNLIWCAFIPVIFSLLPLWIHGPLGTAIQIIGAVFTTALCLVGFGMFGAYFIPLAVLLWAQVFTPLLMMRGSMARPGPGILIGVSAGLVLLLGFVTWNGSQEFQGPLWLVIGPGLIMALLAILLPWRRRWVSIALIAVGLLVMAAGFVAAWPGTYHAELLWPWLAGAMSFAVGHLSLTAGMWHERARNLLDLL